MKYSVISAAAFAFANLFAPEAMAQQSLQAIDLPTGPSGECTSLKNIGDVDGDGIPDLAIASAYETVAGKSLAGRVRVRSGATGSLLLDLFGPVASSVDGTAIDGAGDLNADGHADLWMTAYDTSVSSSYVVRAISGVNGAILRQITVRAWDLAGGRDVDGDSIPDLVVSKETSASPFDLGTVQVYSGASGALLLSHTSVALGEYLPSEYIQRVTWVGDINGNGSPEIAIGSITANGPHFGSGMVRVIDGSTGAILRDAYPSQPSAFGYGYRVANVGDLDGDGFDDLGVRYQDGPCGASFGKVDVLSIATGAVLRTWSGSAPACSLQSGERFGNAIAGVGDVDGDSVVDVLIGIPGGYFTDFVSGGAQLCSGRTGQVLSFILESAPPHLGEFGQFVCAMGDVDGDGRADYAIECSTDQPITPAEPLAGQIAIYSGAPDAIESFGSGCPYWGGFLTPNLAASIPSPNSLHIQVGNANPGAAGVFVVGTTPNFQSIVQTCPLLVKPVLLVLPFSIASNGTYSIQASLSPSLQMSISLQALIHTPGLLGLISSTNGVQISIH